MTKNVTNGELRTYKECKRKWWLGWYRGLRSKRPDRHSAAKLGTLVHLGLQVQYDPTDVRNPYEVVIERITADVDAVMAFNDAADAAEIQKQGELVLIMLEGYFEWLSETGADQGLSIISAETKVTVPFPAFADGSVNLMGKMDIRVQREQDGARLFLDHKTVGTFGQAMKGLTMDEQMLHYHLLEYLDYLQQGLGDDEQHPLTGGGLYNMLRKVKRTANAKPPFYDRVEISHNRDQLRSYYMRVYGEVLDIIATEQRLASGEHPGMVAYPNPTKDCSWKCEFVGVCPMFDERPEAAEQFLVEWFEELDPLDRYDDTDTDDQEM